MYTNLVFWIHNTTIDLSSFGSVISIHNIKLTVNETYYLTISHINVIITFTVTKDLGGYHYSIDIISQNNFPTGSEFNTTLNRPIYQYGSHNRQFFDKPLEIKLYIKN